MSFAVLLVACLITCIPAGIWVAADAKSAWCAMSTLAWVVFFRRPSAAADLLLYPYYAVWSNDCLPRPARCFGSSEWSALLSCLQSDTPHPAVGISRLLVYCTRSGYSPVLTPRHTVPGGAASLPLGS